MYSYGPPHIAGQKQDDQLEHTYSSYVRLRNVALKTCQRRWKIGRSGERGPEISVLAAWHDDDVADSVYLEIYIYVKNPFANAHNDDSSGGKYWTNEKSARFRSLLEVLYFDPRPSPKMLFQGDTPEGSDTFQWPVIERDRVGGLRLMIWDKVKVPLCHYSDAPEESKLWTAWQLFPLDDD